jgi:hypothetical protein
MYGGTGTYGTLQFKKLFVILFKRKTAHIQLAVATKSAVKLRMARAVGTLLLLVFLFSHFGFDKK